MDKVVRNHVVHVVFSDSMDVSEISAEDREMDMRVKTAVKHAIQKAKVCQKPIAKYDQRKKKAYIVHPDGTKRYVS